MNVDGDETVELIFLFSSYFILKKNLNDGSTPLLISFSVWFIESTNVLKFGVDILHISSPEG